MPKYDKYTLKFVMILAQKFRIETLKLIFSSINKPMMVELTTLEFLAHNLLI